MNTLMTCCLALAAAAHLPADAANVERSHEYTKCMKASHSVDPVMLECISDERMRQDQRLNAAYRKLVDLLPPLRRKQLVEAQRLWVKYTEANCGFYWDPEGGTNAKQMAVECEVTARVRRAAELEELARFL